VVLRLTAIENRHGRRIDITWSENGLPALLTHHGEDGSLNRVFVLNVPKCR
jgi:hypothetical protein